MVLFDAHRRRLGVACAEAFDDFAAGAAPGVYAVRAAGARVEVTPRPGSRLRDGIGLRFLPSPVAHLRGPLAKCPASSLWDAVRAAGVATVLTSADGVFVYEACVAAVLAWDGEQLVAPPDDAPRVDSVTQSFLLARHRHRRAPIRRDAGWPLLLVNAVVGACVPEGQRFPEPLRAALVTDVEASARRAP